MDSDSLDRTYDSILKEGTLVIQSYLDAGFDVNALDDDGQTMLSCAAKCGNMELVTFLAQNGANANIMNCVGSKPIHLAAFCGHKDIVKFFLNTGIHIDCRDWDDMTMLHFACLGGHLDVVKYLVSHKCAIDAKDCLGKTPLVLAASNKQLEIVQYLVETGADVDCRYVDGMGILHCACESEGSEDVVKYLLKKGLDPNAQDNYENTPLHYAVLDDHLEYVEPLLKAGADCNAENVFGCTPFRFFILSENLEGITLCLENGAYFQSDHYNIVVNTPLLKEGILQDVKLCTQSLINKFNYAVLPKVYEIPELAQRLPLIEKMRISSHSNMKQNFAECLNYEIQAKEYCNLLNVRPIVLYSLCVASLIQHNVI